MGADKHDSFSSLLVFNGKKHRGMVAVVDGEDRPGKAEIGVETIGLAVEWDFLGVGDNSPRFFRGDLEYLQVVLFDFGWHRVDEGPEDPVKGRMELVGNAAGDVAWVLKHDRYLLGVEMEKRILPLTARCAYDKPFGLDFMNIIYG